MPTRPMGLAVAARVREPSTGGKPLPECRPAESGDMFDLWLRRRLQHSYDAAMADPIPEDLLRLIEEDLAA